MVSEPDIDHLFWSLEPGFLDVLDTHKKELEEKAAKKEAKENRRRTRFWRFLKRHFRQQWELPRL